ncbi:MAG: glutamate racemase [Sphingobacteriales bacterium]|nr:glutamate racemase [Sphingobacteriales bacterium]OJY92459.1 MAG: glutamate racemase [Sphingobacteriales bacterium 44-15]
MNHHPIGIFDSGYGGLTVLRSIVEKLPAYDYIYLGDNARTPYGTRSFETVYHYTLECVQWLFAQGCPLIVLACNTASAKALRTIQQKDLPHIAPQNRVLGVIRPTTEKIGMFTKTKAVGILATKGTVLSDSYVIETSKFFPDTEVYQHACPMWVPLVENNEHSGPGADYFVQKDINELLSLSDKIDTILLACTHYPLLADKIRKYLPDGIQLISQGDIVADSLADYLQRHPEMGRRCSKNASLSFYTTDAPADFDAHAGIFFGRKVKSAHTSLALV